MQAAEISMVFTSICVLISSIQISLHFLNYNHPKLQRFVCRIIGILPVTSIKLYSIQSHLSTLYPEKSLALGALRDFYEAYVLYLFTQLIIEYLGGENSLICLLETKKFMRRPWPMDQMRPIYLGEGFYRNVKQGVLQFVILRPFISVLALFLHGWGKYDEGDFSLDNGYVYCSFVSNVSVSVSLYYLVLLYTATSKELDKSIIYKFLSIKSLIFFSFWQSCLFGLFLNLELFGSDKDASLESVKSQNFLLTIELALGSYFICNAFSHKEFISKQKRSLNLFKSVGDMLNMKDIIEDAQSTFTTNPPHFEFSEYSWNDHTT